MLKGAVLDKSRVIDIPEPFEQLFVIEAKGPPLDTGTGSHVVEGGI